MLVESWVWPHQNQAFIHCRQQQMEMNMAMAKESGQDKVKRRRQRQEKWKPHILLVILRHCEKGSPEYPLLQTQMGMWFLTLQQALTPHSPGHGSWHFLLMQALSEEQSEFMTHSGRQLGGEPIISERQEHWHRSPIFLGGLLLGPQGFGTQGSTSATTGSVAGEMGT